MPAAPLPLLRNDRLRQLPVVLTLLIGLGATLAVWSDAHRHVAERRRAAIEAATRNAATRLQGLLRRFVSIDRAMLGLFRASEQVTRDEFARFVRAGGWLPAQPALQALGFAQAIAPEQLEAELQRIRQDQAPAFSIRPAPLPGARSAPILYIQPDDLRHALSGADLHDGPSTRAALGAATSSAHRQLRMVALPGADRQRLLLASPVDSGGAQLGWTLALIDPDLLLTHAASADELLALELLDLGPAARANEPPPIELRTLVAASPGAELSGLEHVHRVRVLDRRWQLRGVARPGFASAARDGTPGWVLLIGLVLTLQAGALVFSLVRARGAAHALVAERTAELERSRAELSEALGRAQHAMESKSQFLANMSHEIRTPMNAVIGMAGLLQQTELTARQAEFVATIRTSGDALLQTINDILDFSKLEAGKLRLESEAFDLQEEIEQTLLVIAEKVKPDGRVELLPVQGAPFPTHVIGDASRLRQVLLNLLSNATKFTQEGEIGVEVRVLEEGDERVRFDFAVRDTGIGIPDSKKATLFRPFEQVDASTTRKYGGTGLGLAICASILEAMGGAIQIEDNPGGGTVFRFQLDLQLQPDYMVGRSTNLDMLAGLRVMIVDDNPTNCQILSATLSEWRIEAVAFHDAVAALDELKAAKAAGRPYELIILDMVMPGIDGIALARLIDRERDLGGIGKVMLSSVHSVDAPSDAGIAKLLTKPVRKTDLLRALRAVCHGDGNEPTTAQLALAEEDDAARPLIKGAPRILVAEDNQANQTVARLQLEQLGASAVDVVSDGAEAIEMARLGRYDLILMDLQMPQLDGLTATEVLRRHEQQRGLERTPIIAMTANAMAGDRERCLAAGMDDYIPKPIRLGSLKRALGSWLPPRFMREDVSRGRTAEVPPAAAAAAGPLSAERLERAAVSAATELPPEAVERIATLFLEEGQRTLAALRAELARGDLEAARASGHKLRGSALNLGLERFAAACQAIEQAAAAGQRASAADVDALERCLARLARERATW